MRRVLPEMSQSCLCAGMQHQAEKKTLIDFSKRMQQASVCMCVNVCVWRKESECAMHSSFPSLPTETPKHPFFLTSDQARLPPELKHINKGRKRN